MNILEVEDLSQSYGGVQVLRNISFSLKSGENVGLIGPNGAGKSTLINVLCGLVSPKSGQIKLDGHEIVHMPTYKRVGLGLGRSFQLNTLLPDLTVLTNVMIAVQGIKSSRFQIFRSISSYKDILSEAHNLLELIGLTELKDAVVNTLSFGHQRQLEIILALASKPKLLLMDEPSDGLTSGETYDLVRIIRNLVEGTTVFFCAHDMELVFALADRVVVLHEGGFIAQGTPKQIQSDPRVREIYLGIESGNT
jgi:branched-chain amino acid transport system ATP-binding protein